MILYLSSRAHNLGTCLVGENMTRFKESSFHLVVQLLLVMKLMLAMASFLHLFSAQCSTFFKIP